MKSSGLLIVYHILTENRSSKGKSSTKKRTASFNNFDGEYKDKTPIGNAFQADIPELQESSYQLDEVPYKYDDALVWDPSRLPEDVVEKYLDAVGVTRRKRRHQKTSYDEERALFNLHNCDYNVKEAQRRLLNRPAVLLEDAWCEADKNLFEDELRRNGRDFTAIQKVIYWKTTEEIIQYYYDTKKF